MGWSVYLTDITEGQYANPFTPTDILIVLFHSSTSTTVLKFCGSICNPIEVIKKL